MNLINCYGFSVDSQTMRVYLKEGKFAYFSQSIPTGADGVTVGADTGDIVDKLKKVVIRADVNLLYVDLAGKPYPGKVQMWEELPHDEVGRLLVDSVGKIVSTYKGLGFTENGGVALWKKAPDPKTEKPVEGGTYYSDGEYEYAIFQSDKGTDYTAMRTESGAGMTLDVLLVGAGGAGKSQMTFGAKGGDGGGGELVIATLPPAKPGPIIVSVPAGARAKFGDQPGDTTVKEGSVVLTARAGKTAVDKNDADGFEKTAVPAPWNKLNMFTWLLPGSDYVGGVAQSFEQNYPDATFCGEGGAGSKTNIAGNGQESYVAIRWKK